MIIGKFAHEQDGTIRGYINNPFFGDDISLTFQPQTTGPDFRVVTDNGCDFGAGWKHLKDERMYISVKLDNPFLYAPITCALFANRFDPGHDDMVWNRDARTASAASRQSAHA